MIQANEIHDGVVGGGLPPGDEPWPEWLVYSDGEPLDTNQHRIQMNLLIEVIRVTMAARGQRSYFAGGNMFIYYDDEQARFVAQNPPRKYRNVTGPDVFFVDNVAPGDRPAWIVWRERRYPDLIVELLSPSTQHIDRGVKKRRYAERFHTPEYYLYRPAHDTFEAFRLGPGDVYQPAPRNEQGRVWSNAVGAWVGLWQGEHEEVDSTWLRLYDAEGRLVPTNAEQARAERERAEAAEAELARLRALLATRDGQAE